MSLFKVSIAMILFCAAPAWAQKDAMKMGEKLGVAVVKKTDTKTITTPPRPPDKVKAGETLEIETKREVKK